MLNLYHHNPENNNNNNDCEGGIQMGLSHVPEEFQTHKDRLHPVTQVTSL